MRESDDARLLRNVRILNDNLDRWIESYCDDEEKKKTLKELGSGLATLYNRASSAILGSQLYPTKPMSSDSAAILGTVVGGSALGVAAYLDAEKKNEQYKKDYAVARHDQATVTQALSDLRKRNNAIMAILETLPGWVEEQGKPNEEHEEEEFEEGMSSLKRIILSLIMGIILSIITKIILPIITPSIFIILMIFYTLATYSIIINYFD